MLPYLSVVTVTFPVPDTADPTVGHHAVQVLSPCPGNCDLDQCRPTYQ